MPLTPAHAVIALPFIRTPLLPGAIAIGAMAPDLPIFVRGGSFTRELTHNNFLVAGLVAFALALIWYLLLRPVVREVSPAWLARRLPETWDATTLRAGNRTLVAALAAVSLMLGVVTHLVWDAFTHIDGWGTLLFPALLEHWGGRPGYFWMQNLSSLFGLVVLAIFAWLWLRRQKPTADLPRMLPTWLRASLWLALPAILAAAWFWGLSVYGPLRPGFGAEHLAYQVLPPAFTMWGMLMLIICITVLILRGTRARHARSAS